MSLKLKENAKESISTNRSNKMNENLTDADKLSMAEGDNKRNAIMVDEEEARYITAETMAEKRNSSLENMGKKQFTAGEYILSDKRSSAPGSVTSDKQPVTSGMSDISEEAPVKEEEADNYHNSTTEDSKHNSNTEDLLLFRNNLLPSIIIDQLGERPSSGYLTPRNEVIQETHSYLDMTDEYVYDEIKDLKKQQSVKKDPLRDNTYVLDPNGFYMPSTGPYEHLQQTSRRPSEIRTRRNNVILIVVVIILGALLAGGVAAVIYLAVTRQHYRQVVGNCTSPETCSLGCTSQPCLNGGQCTDTSTGYFCNCSVGYQGSTCEIDMSSCVKNPCLNKGTCIPQVGNYICLCPSGYTGIKCQSDVDECASNPCQNDAMCINGINAFLCNCSEGFVGYQCESAAIDSYIAFNAYCKNSHYPPQPKVLFTRVSVNVGDTFDSVQNTFTSPRNGLYWFHLSIMTPVAQVDYKMVLVGSSNTYMNITQTGVRRLDPGKSYHDTQSRDDLRWVQEGAEFFVSSGYDYGTTFGVSDLPIAVWSGFVLDTLMSPFIAFKVYQNSIASSPNNSLASSPNNTVAAPFPFVTVVLNEGEGWNAVQYKFVAPYSGVYVFSYSTSCEVGWATEFNLVIDGRVLYNAEVSDTLHGGVDTASRTVPVSLKKGQKVWITSNGLQSSSDIYQMSSFKGFLYSPIHGINVVWSVHTLTQLFVASGGGSSDMGFEIVAVNVGNVWQSSKNQSIIPVTGTYYVELIATQQETSGCEIYIYINGDMYAIAYKSWGQTTGPITRETASITTLQEGDVVSVRFQSGGRQGYTSFIGFLLFPST